jgi:putative spermidine/putrescine transport system permease protein
MRVFLRTLFTNQAVGAERPIVIRLGLNRLALWVVFSVVAALSSLPFLYTLLWSFAGSDTVGIIGQPSPRWFVKILTDAGWQQSFAYSTGVALVSSTAGTTILLLHFYFVRYSSPFTDRLAYALVLPMILVPAVVYSLALRMGGGSLGLPEAVLLTIGHFVLVLPIQYYVFESSQDAVPSSILFAGSTLGAGHWQNLTYVYLPLVKSAVANAIIIGFFASFDELVLSTFILDSPTITVPRRLWNDIDRSQEPAPAVVAVLLLTLYLVISLLRLTLSKLFVRLATDSGRVGQ